MIKNHKNRVGVVYSTNPNYQYEFEQKQERATLAPEKQVLKILFDAKRKGKGMTVIKNFSGSEDDMKTLAKKIKNHCGSGGSIKEGDILIQGDMRKKINDYLVDNGYKVKRIN